MPIQPPSSHCAPWKNWATCGWSSDPTPTLAEFQAYVAAGDIGYYVESGRGGMAGPGGGASTASAIQEWVAANYTAETVGGQTVYDLGGGS